MTPEKVKDPEVMQADGGKIVFANDVIATIAGLAAAEVEGVESMSGNIADGISGMLGKKNLAKGVKVDVNENDTAIEVAIVAKYGYKIHEVCKKIQESIKRSVENMTGLNVTVVNVSVQAVSFEKAVKEEQAEPVVTEE